MTTMEKLLVQIFEKKRRIIEHLKQQKQFYDQRLASKLVIQGITPPPWLLNSEFPSSTSDLTAINKEELISGLLLQQPGPLDPNGPCFLYDKSVATAVDDVLPHETCAKTCSSSNGSEGDEPGVIPSSHIDDTGEKAGILPPSHVNSAQDTLNYVPMSPEDQTDTMNPNKFVKLEQSLARMQRSRSRQKALELRNSAKASGKSCLGKDINVVSSCNKAAGYDQPCGGVRKSFELSGPLALPTRISEEAVLGDCSNKGLTINACSTSPSQSKGNMEKELQTDDEEKMEMQSNVNVGRITRSRSRCSKSIIGDHQTNRKSHDIDIGAMTRSRSSKAQLPGTSYTQFRRVTRSSSYRSQPINGSHAIENSKLDCGRITKSRSSGAKEAETKNNRSRTKNEMSVKPKQLDFDEADIQTEGKGNLEENTRDYLTKEKSAFLSCALSAERTSRKCKSLTCETQEVLEIEDDPSLSKRNRIIGQTSLLMDRLPDSQETQEHMQGIMVEYATDPSLSILNIDIASGLSSQKRKFEPQEEQELNRETSCLSLPNADTEATMSLDIVGVEPISSLEKPRHGLSSCNDCNDTTYVGSPIADGEATMSLHIDAVEANVSPEPKTRDESSSCNDFKAPLETHTKELVQPSPGRISAGLLATKLESPPVNISDETMSELASEMFKSDTQVRNAGMQTPCLSSNVGDVGCSLLEAQAEIDVLPEYNVSNAINGSWPGCKRRKIGYQHYKSASPRVRVNTFLGINGNIPKKSLYGVEENSSCICQKLIISPGSNVMFLDPEFVATNAHGVKYLDSEEPKPAPKVQHEEGKVSLERSVMMPITCEEKQLSASRVSLGKIDMTTKPSDCFSEGEFRECPTSTIQCSGRLGNSTDKFIFTNMMLDKRLSPQKADKFKFPIALPLIERMDVDEADVGRSVPEFESFIIAENRELHNAACGLLNGEIRFLSEKAGGTNSSEQLDRPTSLSTPVSPFPTAYKPYVTPGVKRSLSSGLIDNIELTSNQLSNDDALQEKSYYDYSFPGKTLGKTFMSPVGKGYEGITSKSGGSDKLLSGNPEYICFPIEEDPETSDEDVNASDISGTDMNGADSNVKSSPVREPLRDITTQNKYIMPSSHAVTRGSLESVTTEIGIAEKHNKGNKKSEMHQRSGLTRPWKASQSLSTGANRRKKQSDTLSSMDSKAKLPPSSRSRGESLSEKEPKSNNIVCNMKSFIPSVKPKISVDPGKRKVDVKALKVGQANKRREDQKENERKQKKEAFKQLRLEKKLKEEERKKREAEENAEKKRQRVEEESKKERKRQRIEEARCQQKEAEEKIRAWREQSRSETEDWKPHERKDSNNKAERATEKKNESRNPVNERVENGAMEADNALPSTNDNKSSTGSTDTGKVGSIDVADISTPNCDKTDKLIDRPSQEQSYDISPYQCSDDEEEEDEDIPNKKFIPTWASKSCVAVALSSVKHLDPDMIFPPGSFCSLEEVLLPRRLAQK